MLYTYSYASPLGEITLAGNEHALTGLWFVGQKYYADTLSGSYTEKILPIFQQTAGWLDIYFSGKEPDFMPALFMSGTPFQMEVWEILKEIPYGQTTTYRAIAERIAFQHGISRTSAQAVGGAVGHNPISIIVPCHRVVGANGSLTGYAGGVERKMELLKLENTDMFIPASTLG